MRITSNLAVILIAVTLQGCTIAYYSLQNKIESSPTKATSCDFKYSISLTSGYYTNTFGMTEAGRERLLRSKNKYMTATTDVFRERNCKTAYVETADEANFVIQIQELPKISALPQEWLTGLSFGLIPSWGTRHSEFTYSFKNKLADKAHTYTVDTKSYNHLVLFPVFWISFFTLDENGEYKDALTNFLTHD